MAFDPLHGPNRSEDNDPLLSPGRIGDVRYFLDELATLCQKIEDKTLRMLILATIELRSANPELLRHDFDLKSLALVSTQFTEGISQPASETVNAAGILSAIYKGAASAIDGKELDFEYALYLINKRPGETPGGMSQSEDNGFDFAVQYGSAGYSPRELFTAFSSPGRDPLAEHFGDREILLITLFKSGYALLAQEPSS